MAFTHTEQHRIALYAAGKVALAARLMLSATPQNISGRAGHLETCLDEYDRKVLEMSETHLQDT